MNRLQLATLLSWAGNAGLQGRKRLQKVVYLLQEAGCPFRCRYVLHNYGPYSRDVADACDEIVAAGLVDENGAHSAVGMQYSYSLKPTTRQLLQQSPDLQMQPFQQRGTALINENLWTLELGSTILFYYRQTGNWEEALNGACAFKKMPPDAQSSQAALALAMQFESRPAN